MSLIVNPGMSTGSCPCGERSPPCTLALENALLRLGSPSDDSPIRGPIMWCKCFLYHLSNCSYCGTPLLLGRSSCMSFFGCVWYPAEWMVCMRYMRYIHPRYCSCGCPCVVCVCAHAWSVLVACTWVIERVNACLWCWWFL